MKNTARICRCLKHFVVIMLHCKRLRLVTSTKMHIKNCGWMVRIYLLHLASHCCCFESRQGLWIIMWGNHPISFRNDGGFARVPIRVSNNARRVTWGLPPPMKAGKSAYDLSSVWAVPISEYLAVSQLIFGYKQFFTFFYS